jgi:hypothetical protein
MTEIGGMIGSWVTEEGRDDDVDMAEDAEALLQGRTQNACRLNTA